MMTGGSSLVREHGAASVLPEGRLALIDRIGMFLSSLCLIHCLLLPLVIVAMPALGAMLPGDFEVHAVLIGSALPVTGFALWRGSRHHGDRKPLLIGIAGLTLVAAALPLTTIVPVEAGLTVSGGLLVVFAHVRSWRAHKRACAQPGHRH